MSPHPRFSSTEPARVFSPCPGTKSQPVARSSTAIVEQPDFPPTGTSSVRPRKPNRRAGADSPWTGRRSTSDNRSARTSGHRRRPTKMPARRPARGRGGPRAHGAASGCDGPTLASTPGQVSRAMKAAGSSRTTSWRGARASAGTRLSIPPRSAGASSTRACSSTPGSGTRRPRPGGWRGAHGPAGRTGSRV